VDEYDNLTFINSDLLQEYLYPHLVTFLKRLIFWRLKLTRSNNKGS